ncbi:MAG: TonB-dependent receptor [Cyclobacteriaceae bacterium]
MRILLFAIFFLTTWLNTCAQSASIAGKAATENEPISCATVELIGENKTQGAYTDENGNFAFTKLQAGSYALVIRSVGFRTNEQIVELNENSKVALNIDLSVDRLSLDEVVVSGTRYALDRRESPVVVGVLNPKIFAAVQSTSLSEGLNFQPGLRVENNCQNCGFTQVRLNGLDGAYSQILVNSRAVFSALNGVYGLDQIPANIVERVEVVRGGGSALYGSNAIGGTINIITKEPVDNSWQVGSNLSLIDGQSLDQSVNYNGTVVSKDLRSGVTLYGLYRDRESYDANDDGFTETTALENNTFGIKTFVEPGQNNRLTLDFNAIKEYRRGGDHLDLASHFTDITEELDHNTVMTGVTFDQFSSDNLNKYSGYVSSQSTKRGSFYGGLGGGRTAADSALALNAYGTTDDLALVSGIQYMRSLGELGAVTAGVEHQLADVEDKIPGYNKLIDQHVSTIGLFSQLEWKPSAKFTTLLGARYDHTTVNGQYQVGDVSRASNVELGVLSPRLTLLYKPSRSLQIRGGYARGFRAPQAFNEDLHISSVGGEPLFVIMGEDLDKELSDSFTGSVNYVKDLGKTQFNFLVEGFYTELRNPFTIVSAGPTLPNGSILEEVRNGDGAYVTGANFEFTAAPSARWYFQAGGTLQRSLYRNGQVLFEAENPNEAESNIVVNEFTRTPNVYGYFATNWSATEKFQIDLTGTYTGSMIVPRVVSETGFLDLLESNPFLDMNIKLTRHFQVSDHFHLELSGGVQNVFNSYQDDFDTGPTRDSDYVYGPNRPRTFFFGIKIGDFH